jgi:TonB-linked SusC/RagA family outer membrane protein
MSHRASNSDGLRSSNPQPEANVGIKRLFALASLAALVAAPSASAQQRRITGHVVATTGEPISSAHIQVQGTTFTALSTDDGSFTTLVPEGSQVLQVRRIGYKHIDFILTSTANDVKIELTKDVLELEQMVVTGTTTSISSVNAANGVTTLQGTELNEVPAPTIENVLQGRIPGAVITTNSGAPGGGAQVQLRGTTSINASSSPLYVVDGVLVSNAAIETGLNSITNAGAGIATSQDQMANRIADIAPEDIESIEVLKGASAGAIYGSKASNGVIIITTKRGTSGKPKVSLTQSVGTWSMANELNLRCFSSATDALTWYHTYIATPTTPLPYAWQPKCYDFQKELYAGSGPSYQTDLNVNGGTPQTGYFLGGSFKRDNGIQLGTYFQRQSITANINQLIGDHVTVRFNNNFIHSLGDRGISGNDNSPVVSPGDIFSSTPQWVPLSAQPYMSNPFVPDGANPFADAAQITNPEEVYRYIGSINGTLSAYASQRQTLDFTFIGGVDSYSDNSRLYAPPTNFVEISTGEPGLVVTNRTNVLNANLNLSGQHKYITDLFTATTSFGMRQESRGFDQILNQGKDFPLGITDVQFGVNQSLTEQQQLIHDFSYYLQEEFLLKDRLLLTAAINEERSSVNGDDHKFYSYPKFAASYRVPGIPAWMNDLKFRAAWGEAGNQPPYGEKYTSLPSAPYSGQIGAVPSTVAGDPNIIPETSTETEGGVDITMWHSRAALSVTLFQKKVTNLILGAPLPPSSGFTTAFINGGSMTNTGVEYQLDITPVQVGKFSWISRTMFANVASQITSLSVPCFNAGSAFAVAYGESYICAGRSATTVEGFQGKDSVTHANIPLYLDAAPKYTVGFSNEFNYGPFRLYSLIDWRQGGYAVDLTQAYYDPTYLLSDTAASTRRNTAIGAGFSPYLQPAGFVKFRELTLSYMLPKSLVQGWTNGATNIRLSVSGRNLWTWSKYGGYDPEVSNFSDQNVGRFQDVTPYPPARSVFFSLSANF